MADELYHHDSISAVIEFDQRHWQSLSPFAPAFLDNSLDFFRFTPGWLP